MAHQARRDARFAERAHGIAAALVQRAGASRAVELLAAQLLRALPSTACRESTRDKPPHEELPPEEQDVIVARRLPPVPRCASPSGAPRPALDDGDARMLAFDLRAVRTKQPHRSSGAWQEG